MHRSWRTVLPLVALIVLVGYLYTHRGDEVVPPSPPAATTTAPARESGARASGTRLPAFLPSEAGRTLALIAAGGPFPYRQDGAVFGNYEHLLPAEPRGYYHEYTVQTPGAPDRGARRIITGGDPPVAYWYTDDHYRSFRRFEVPR